MKRLLFALLFVTGFAWADGLPPIFVSPQGSITISCTSSSAATALPTVGGDTLRNLELQNAGSVPIFVETGISTVAATVATGYPILPGQSKVVTISRTSTHVACIVAATTTTLYVSVGSGE